MKDKGLNSNVYRPWWTNTAQGGGGALPLGAMGETKKKPAARICRVHRWRRSKWSRQCSICGLVEDRDVMGSSNTMIGWSRALAGDESLK